MKFASQVMMTLLVFAILASAQEQKKQTEADLPDNLKQRLEREVARATTVRKRHMATIVTLIVNTCELDEKQAKRLELASKGAIEQSLRTFRKWLIGRFDGKDFDVGFIRHTGTEATHEKVWKQALDQTLNANQKRLWKEEQDKRKTFQRNAMIQAVLSEVDAQVVLTSKQLVSLEKWLKESEVAPETFAGDVRSATNRIMPLLARYPEADLKKVLMPNQIDGWNEFVGRYARLSAPPRRRNKN